MAAAADPAAFMRQIAQGSAHDSLGFLVWPAVELGSSVTRPYCMIYRTLTPESVYVKGKWGSVAPHWSVGRTAVFWKRFPESMTQDLDWQKLASVNQLTGQLRISRGQGSCRGCVWWRDYTDMDDAGPRKAVAAAVREGGGTSTPVH